MTLPSVHWPPELSSAAALLLNAANHADAYRRSRWDFAVSITELCQFGLTHADLRGLVCQGRVEHAQETSVWPSPIRSFQPMAQWRFGPETCFVLTDMGRSAAEMCLTHAFHENGGRQWPSVGAPATEPLSENGGVPEANACRQTVSSADTVHSDSPLSDSPLNDQLHVPKPVWNPELRSLFLGNVLVKEYRTPAPNQELLLTSLEEVGWPPWMAAPLRPVPGRNPKRRLHDAIAGLNSNQLNPLLRFTGDGAGRGVKWIITNFGSFSPTQSSGSLYSAPTAPLQTFYTAPTDRR